MNNRFKSYAESANFGPHVALTLYQEIVAENAEPALAVANLTLVKVEAGQILPEPTVKLHRDDAQALMDALWNVGLRPTEGSGSAGSLAATERHLEDMRRLVFDRGDERVAISEVPR